jgi:hypothetical protein
MENDIAALFRTRDEAASRQDARLFLSTQVAEIEFASSESYLATKNITTEVLHIHNESELQKVVFVKETYAPQGKFPRSAFLIYFLAHTKDGWRIYRAR